MGGRMYDMRRTGGMGTLTRASARRARLDERSALQYCERKKKKSKKSPEPRLVPVHREISSADARAMNARVPR